MFDRIRIKEMAKTALKRGYWMVIVVAVLVGLLGGHLAGGFTAGDGINIHLDEWNSATTDVDMDADVNIPNGGVWDPAVPDNPWMNGGNNVWESYDNPYTNPYAEEDSFSAAELWSDIQKQLEEWSNSMGWTLSFLLGILVILAILAAIGATLFSIFVGNVMTVGGHGWMLRHWRGENAGVGEAFAAFRIYKPSVVTMLVRNIYTWLWSLLFVIPGIVKGYAYSMTPYIIYENPNLTANQAIKMSKIMTRGYKWDLFVLNLSFIGWAFLSAITGGLVGIFWSNPYRGLSHAGAYEDLKWKAIQSGKLTWEDFGQLPPPPVDPFADQWSNPAPNTTWGNSAPQQPWGNPAPQQPWGAPAPQQPQQPAWGAPPPASPTPPQQTESWNNPTDVRW